MRLNDMGKKSLISIKLKSVNPWDIKMYVVEETPKAALTF